MLYEHDKKRSLSSTAGSVVLLSRPETPEPGGTCSGRGRKGAAAVAGRSRYAARASPRAGAGGSWSHLTGREREPHSQAGERPEGKPLLPRRCRAAALTGPCVFFLLKPRSDPPAPGLSAAAAGTTRYITPQESGAAAGSAAGSASPRSVASPPR